MNFQELKQYYAGKRVLVTGHTGFKGSWLSLMLKMLGAEVYGYALEAPTEPNLFSLLQLSGDMRSEIGDIRDFDHLQRFYREAAPELVLHLAAQPIVRESYVHPRETYESNVMGTVNLLECVRQDYLSDGKVKSVLNVTTDKVYENQDLTDHPFREDEKLDGFDPYSNSKSCSELVTHSYKKSFFSAPDAPRISTARAGNVIGGGDFAADRIIPDCVRDTMAGREIRVRNPYSTRPYQHVLEPLLVYLELAAKQAGYEETDGTCQFERGARYEDYYNVGPARTDAITTGALCDLFVKNWGAGAAWKNMAEENAPHEAAFLQLDCGKLRQKLSWQPRWTVAEAVAETVQWYRTYAEQAGMREYTEQQIRVFLEQK